MLGLFKQESGKRDTINRVFSVCDFFHFNRGHQSPVFAKQSKLRTEWKVWLTD